MLAAALTLTPDDLRHEAAVEALYDRAFGPGRFAKVSYRVREAAGPFLASSRLAWRADRLVGACRLWAARCGAAPIVFLGPLAVDGAERGEGVGQRLTEEACAGAEADGARAVVLVGDLAFFERAGFRRAEPGAIILPGPVDPRRILLRGADVAGHIPGGLS
jgi:predicted N-acetyltransferase YhbS